MIIALNFIAILLLAFHIACNVTIITECTVSEMKEDFIDDQCLLGKIFANIFYAPAWLFKGIKFLVNKFVA